MNPERVEHLNIIKRRTQQHEIILNPRWPLRQVKSYHSLITFIGDWVGFLYRFPPTRLTRQDGYTRLIGRVKAIDSENEHVLQIEPFKASFDLRHRKFVWISTNAIVPVQWSDVLVTIGTVQKVGHTPYHSSAIVPSKTFSKDMYKAMIERFGKNDQLLERFLERFPALAYAQIY